MVCIAKQTSRLARLVQRCISLNRSVPFSSSWFLSKGCGAYCFNRKHFTLTLYHSLTPMFRLPKRERLAFKRADTHSLRLEQKMLHGVSLEGSRRQLNGRSSRSSPSQSTNNVLPAVALLRHQPQLRGTRILSESKGKSGKSSKLPPDLR